MRRRDIAKVLFIALALGSLLVLVWKPILEKSLQALVAQKLRSSMEAQVSLQELSIDIFPPRIRLTNLEIKKSSGPLEYIGISSVSVEPGVAPIFLGRVALKNVEVFQPSIRLRLQPSKKEKPKESPEFGIPRLQELIRVQLANLSVHDARLSIEFPAQKSKLTFDAAAFSFREQNLIETWSWKGSGKIEREGRKIQVPRLELIATRKGTLFDLRVFELKNDQFQVNVKGPAFPKADLGFRFTSSTTKIFQNLKELGFLETIPDVQTDFVLQGTAEGDWERMSLNGKLTTNEITAKGHSLGTLQAQFLASENELKDLSISLYPKEGQVRVQITDFTPSKSGKVFVSAKKIPYKAIEDFYQKESETNLVGMVDVEARGVFGLSPLRLDANYSVRVPKLDLLLSEDLRRFLPFEFKNVLVRGKAILPPRSHFQLRDGKVEALGVSGDYQFDFFGKKKIQSKWNARVTDLGQVFHPAMPVSGGGSVGGGIQIDGENQDIVLDLALDSLGYENYESLQTKGAIHFLEDATKLSGFELKRGNRSARFEGFFPSRKKSEEQGSLEAEFTNLDLGWASKFVAKVYPFAETLEGSGSGKLVLKGMAEDQETSGFLKIIGDGGTFHHRPYEKLELGMDFIPRGIRISKGSLEGRGYKLRATGEIQKEQIRGLTFDFTELPLLFLGVPSIADEWVSHTSGKVNIEGSALNPTITGNFNFLKSMAEGEFRFVGDGEVMGEMERLQFSASLWNEGIVLSGEVDAKNLDELTISGAWNQFHITPYLPGSKSNLTGVFSLQGSPKDPKLLRGSADISKWRVDIGDWYLEIPEKVRLDLSAGKLRLPKTAMRGISTDLAVQAELDTDGAIYGSLSGSAAAQILRLFIPGLDRAEGQIVVDGGVRGRLNDPILEGKASLQNGYFLLKNFPHPFEAVQSSIEFAQRALLFRNLDGVIAEGRFTGSGDLQLPSEEKELTVYSNFDIQRAKLRYPDWIPSTVTGRLSILGPVTSPVFRGDFLIHEATYREKWDWKSKILTFRKRRRVERVLRADESRIVLDILFRSDGDSIQIKNNLAEGTAQGAIRLGGTDQRITLDGSIDLREGEVTFLDNKFEIQSGEIRFLPEGNIDPKFDITARTRVEDVDIFLDIRTEGEEVVATLSSQPSKDETNLISLLTLGLDLDNPSNLTTDTGNVPGAMIPSVLTGPVQSRIESGLREAKIVDTLQFVPYFSSRTNSTGLKMIVGKQLFPKVRLLYATDLFSAGEENVLQLEQKLNRVISLQGTLKDNQSRDAREDIDLGLDLEFRFDF